jgi:phosphoribosylglycinamide formyltransferase 1
MMPQTGRPIRLGVLISGGGTTLANLQTQIEQGSLNAEIPLVIASRSDCAGIARAEAAGLPCRVVARRNAADTSAFSAEIFDHCRAANVDLVAMGGFLCRVEIPMDFANRVLNIHPALIPAFCGRGMYGHRIHEAVLSRGCKVSGCTVHFADNEYDHGPIVVQHCVPVHDDDTPDSLAARVFEAECDAYPEAIRLYAEGRLRIDGRRVYRLPSGGD